MARASKTDRVITYEPRGASRDLFHDHSDEILLAGPAGTGKSLSCLHKAHLMLSKYPMAKGFIARKTRTSMTNSCLQTFERHVLAPEDKVHFHKQDQQFNYPNGSMLAVIGLDDPERIKSTDWDFGFVQEATECTENDIEICTTRLRNWIIPYQQLMMDCNPDRPNHWLKKRADKGLTKMLMSYHKDNPRLWHLGGPISIPGCSDCGFGAQAHWSDEGKKYLAKLDRLSGARRSRLYLGQWVSAEGMVYDTWDPLVHMISRADLPEGHWNWPHYWSLDWGHTHPLVWQDWIEHPQTGVLYLVNQIYQTKMLVEDLARWVKKLTEDKYVPRAIICDHDAGDRAVFERHTGYLTLPAYKPISTGVQAVKKRMNPEWSKEGPGLMLVRDSLINEPDKDLEDAGKPTKTEDEFDGYVWDRDEADKANRKKDEIPVDKDNHGMDGKRYMVAFIDSLADDPEDFEAVVINEDEVSISPY